MSAGTSTTLHSGHTHCHTRSRLPNFVLSQPLPHHFQRQSVKLTFPPCRRQPERAGYVGHAARLSVHAAADPVVANTSHKVTTTVWRWEGYDIRVQQCGDSGPALVCVHGFGGNCAHWRKNLPVLGKEARVYAIDLLGYGYSDKPNPRLYEVNELYNFETWGRQLSAFIAEVVKEPAFLICNSVGGIAGLQAAVQDPEHVLGVQLQNVSLRMLHKKRQSAIQRPFVKALQTTLRTTPLGKLFFSQIATKKGVKSVLSQAYADANQVTDELVDCILQPGLQEGAVDVFLDFISYSGGPLAEDLLEVIKQPVSILWGAEDPWEKVEWGRKLQHYPTVEEFVAFPGVGHCPMDEAPDLINPAIMKFVRRHAKSAV
ncbi:hypothetical protein ABBQ32_008291 [Trebouxia sp. C0010 RCD-2024]